MSWKNLKIILIVFVLVLSFALVACEDNPETDEVIDNKTEASWILLTIDFPEESGLEDISEYKVYTLNEKGTPLSILQSYGETTKVPVVVADGPLAYVQGIGGVFENDFMKPSGWVYTVNSEVIMEAADSYELMAEDSVVWSYVSYNEGIFE